MSNKKSVEKRTKITKVVLTVGGREYYFTYEEVKELHALLNSVFNSSIYPQTPTQPYTISWGTPLNNNALGTYHLTHSTNNLNESSNPPYTIVTDPAVTTQVGNPVEVKLGGTV